MMKIRRFQLAAGLLFGTTLTVPASAEEYPSIIVDVRGSDRSATEAGLLQHVDIEVNAQGFSIAGIDRPEHPFHALWQRIENSARNSLPGMLEPGITTGFGVTSLRLSFSAWPEGKPLVGHEQPLLWKPILAAIKEFQNYQKDQALLPPEEREGSTPERNFLRYFSPSGAFAFRAAWFCAALPYVTEVTKDLGSVPSLAALQETWCDPALLQRPQLFIVNDFGSLRSELPGHDELSPDEILFNRRLADRLVSLWRPSLDICGAERAFDSRYVQELLAARWIPASIVRPSGISASEFEAACSETLGKRIIAKTGEALRYWAEQGIIFGHNQWLYAVLRNLALDQKDQWRTAAMEAPRFAQKLADDLIVLNGYTNAPFKKDEALNVTGMLQAARHGQTGPRLLNTLLWPFQRASIGENRIWDASPYLQEMRQPGIYQGEYLKRLRNLVTASCPTGPVAQPAINAQCLYDSVIAIQPDDVAQIELQSNGVQVVQKYGLNGVIQ